MVTLVNRAKMSTSTTGTGTITLGSAETGYQSFADAGVANGDVIRYVIEDGDAWEIGSGTYTATGTTLTRTVDESSNSDAALNLSGSAVVFITASAGDVFQGELYSESYDGTSTKPNTSGTNTIAIGVNAYAPNEYSIAIGRNASTQGGASGIALGEGADARNAAATALGYNTYANAFRSTAIGVNGAGGGSQAIGSGVTTGKAAMALGGSYASGVDSLAAAIATNSSTYGATGSNSVAIGYQAKATASSSIAIGNSAIASSANQVALGGSGTTIKISGAYTLPTSDGTNGQVLTTDGSGAVTFATPSGGGGADLYAANEVSVTTQPSATGDDAIAIGDSAVASGANALAGPFSQASGTNSFAAAIGSTSTSWGAKGDYGIALGFEARAETGTTGAVAIGHGADTRGTLGVAIGDDAYVTANGTRAIAIGYQAEAGAAQSFAAGDAPVIGSSGTSAVALGTSYANAQDAFAAGITNNTSSYGATGANSIALGYQSKATSADSIAIGEAAQSTGARAYALGRNAAASGVGSYCIGDDTAASQLYAMAYGKKAKSDVQGKHAFGTFTVESSGDIQSGLHILYVNTTDATATALSTSNSAASSNNQIILPNNSAYSFSGTIIARESAAAGSDYASWEIKGALLRDANAASTVLGNGIVNKLYATSGASAWAVALSADTTNGGLKIEVTGAAATNIRWVATVNTSEVTYA